jgi:hypothetical protein
MEVPEISRIMRNTYCLSSRIEVTVWVWHNKGHSLLLVLHTKLDESFSARLGVVYGPLNLHIPPVSVRRREVSTYKAHINFKSHYPRQ